MTTEGPSRHGALGRFGSRRTMLVGLLIGVVFLVVALLAIGYLTVGVAGAAQPFAPPILIGLSVLALGLLVVAFFAIVLASPEGGSYLALLLSAASFLPGLAAVTSVWLYLFPPSGWDRAVLAAPVGLLVAAILWLLLPLILHRLARPESANMTIYGGLRARVAELQGRRILAQEVEDHAGELFARSLGAIAREIGVAPFDKPDAYVPPDPATAAKWVDGVGYVDAWRRLHRLDENLIRYLPARLVEVDAFDNELRLKGSRVENRAAMIRASRAAREILRSKAPTRDDLASARYQVGAISRALHDYRDDRWEGLVRARNRILRTVAYTGLVAYLVLAIALMRDAGDRAIVSAAGIYLVGAVVGLFAQLRSHTETESVVEDYGLATARLIAAPLLSGLAAVAGVFLIAMLTAEPIADVVGGGDQDQAAAQYPSLLDVFDTQAHPFALVLAAIFGLTPQLLLDRLTDLTKRYAVDLQKSEPGGHGDGDDEATAETPVVAPATTATTPAATAPAAATTAAAPDGPKPVEIVIKRPKT